MKDTLITAKAKKRELLILLYCFLAANIINIGCIVAYDTRWVEVFSQLGYVAVFTVVLYAVVFAVRLVIKLFCRKRRAKDGFYIQHK